MANPLRGLSFPVALVLLCVVVVGGLALLFRLGLQAWAWALFVLVAILGILYLREYASRPYVGKSPTAGAPPPAPPAVTEPATSSPVPGEPPSVEAPSPTDLPIPAAELVDDGTPFDDPVEEADRVDRRAEAPGPEPRPD